MTPRFTWNIVLRGVVVDALDGTYTEAVQYARLHGHGARVSAPADPNAATSIRIRSVASSTSRR